MRHTFKPLALAVGTALAAMSAAMPAAQAQTPPAKMERVEITGSMIKRVSAETPAPVTVIKREDIERSGASSLEDLLSRESVTGGGGLSDLGAGNGFAAGTASISLRGMGSAATLTLVNGRRLAPAAVVDPNSGKSTVFNINSIPLAAVERVEILKDGASSLYGSDAMAGVVNIILRKDYQGRLISASAQQNDHGLFRTWSGSAMLGQGDLSRDGFNVFLGIDAYRRDGVLAAEAPDQVRQELYGATFGRLATDSTSSYPGNLYTYANGAAGSFRVMLPGCAAENQVAVSATNAALSCKYNSDAVAAMYVSQQKRDAVFGRASWQFNANTELHAELLLSRVETRFSDAPPSRTEQQTFWGDAQGKSVRFAGLALPASHPDNPTRLASKTNPVVLKNSLNSYTFTAPTVLGLRYRFTDVEAGRTTLADNARLVVSGTTVWQDWDLDAGVLLHEQKNTQLRRGRLSMSGLNQALSSGSYRFGGSNSPEVLAGFVRSTEDEGKSSTAALDLRASRELGRLEGGPAMLGLGTELRREQFRLSADENIAKGDIIGVGIGEADGSRRVYAAYAELQAPVLKGLETQAALRAEHYSDFGSAITGKLGAKYQVVPQLALRATFATGFRAPSLSQISKGSVFAFTSVQDKKLCPVLKAGDDNCSRNISSVNQANPDLGPEKSKSLTLGLVAEPVSGAEVVLDAWYFHRRDEVDRLDAQQVVDREDEFAASVIRQAPVAPATLGPILQVLRKFRNMALSKTAGMDYEMAYRWRLNNGDMLKLKFSGTRTLLRKQQDEAGQPLESVLGYYGAPRAKNKLALDWDRGPWSVTLTGNYQAGFKSFDQGGSCPAELTSAKLDQYCTLKSYATADLALGYKGFKNVKLNATVRNLSGAKPPFDPVSSPSSVRDVGYNPDYYNVYGRYITLSASYEF